MKKGFTLAELIAVLVVLALISMIAIPAVTNTLTKYKGNICVVQMNNIIEAGRSWGSSNIGSLPAIDTDEPAVVTFSDLIKYGYIDENLKDPKTKEKFNNAWKIKITKQNRKYIYDIYNGDNHIDINDYCG